MFHIAYMDLNEVDLVILSDPFPTRAAAAAALCSGFHVSSEAEHTIAPERCVLLEVPDAEPRIRYKIVYRDQRSRAIWIMIPVNGKKYWDTRRAARIALRILREKPIPAYGRRIDPKNFRIESFEWSYTEYRRKPGSPRGRRIPWNFTPAWVGFGKQR